MPPGTRYFLEVNPRIPKRLARLEELAQNLWYSWDRPTRALFAKLNPPLWDAVGHSPKAMLKRIDEQRLIDAATDPAFSRQPTRVLAAFDAYHAEPPFRQNAGGCSAKTWWRISAPNSAYTKACRSIPAASASWPATTARRRAISSCRSWPSASCTGRAISPRRSTATAASAPQYYDSDFEDLPIDAVKRKDGPSSPSSSRCPRASSW
jgi:starch phosphorylase